MEPGPFAGSRNILRLYAPLIARRILTADRRLGGAADWAVAWSVPVTEVAHVQDTDLFLSMAEIAGVFVGFGALIAVRSGAGEVREKISDLRWVMSSAIWAVIAALGPILISRYGVSDHELWLVSSLLALVLFAVMLIVNGLAPENLADVAATLAATPRAVVVLVMGPTFWLPTACLVLALGLVTLDLFPEREQALYLTAVGLGLFMAALHLFVTVFWQRPPPVASDRDGPRPGGPGASPTPGGAH